MPDQEVQANESTALLPRSGAEDQSPKKPSRVAAYDIGRGWLCVFMAIDHSFFLSGRQHPTETYSTIPDVEAAPFKNTEFFMLRFVSHLCAPGFGLLLGFGLSHLIESRRRSGWEFSSLFKFISARASLLILLAIILPYPLYAAFLPGVYVNIDIIFTLGFNYFLLGAVLISASNMEDNTESSLTSNVISIALLAGAIMMAVLTCLLAAVADHLPKIIDILFVYWGQVPVLSRFAPFAWSSCIFYGAFFGRIAAKSRMRNHGIELNILCALVLFLLFMTVRITGSFGNLVPVEPEFYRRSWKHFLYTVKYPPSLAFCLLFLSLNHVLYLACFLFERFSPMKPLLLPFIMFGSSPFAFYITHLFLLATSRAVFAKLGLLYSKEQLGFGFEMDGFGLGLSFWLSWIFVIFGLVWPLCQWFTHFKRRQPLKSFWRLF